MFRATVSSVNGETDKNLINFIATTVETMREQMAAKADLAALKDQMATKGDLARVESKLARVESVMVTKGDLAALKDQMATKNDLASVELKLDAKMTTIRGDIEQIQVRLDSIDHALTNRTGMIEIDISRLRSVLYLLVKDQPDMLRLLGQPTFGESRPQG
jgi:hypothetical protein